jgi:hypothetical protein
VLAFVVEAEAYAAQRRTLRPVENRSPTSAPLPWTQEPGPRPAEVAGRPRERHIDPNGYLPTAFLAEAGEDERPLLTRGKPARPLQITDVDRGELAGGLPRPNACFFPAGQLWRGQPVLPPGWSRSPE